MTEAKDLPQVAGALLEEVRQMRKDLAERLKKLIAVAAMGAILVSFAIIGTFFSWRAANTNTQILRLAKPVLNPQNVKAGKKRQACLVLLAADKPVDARCEEIRQELIQIQAGR